MSRTRAARNALPIAEPRRLRAALASLDRRERRVLELRYGIGEIRPQSLRQIGRRFGISGERVRQIETRALRRLADPTGDEAVEPVTGARRTGPAKPSLPGQVLQAWILVLLRGAPAHGYELTKRLQQSGLGPARARLYRLLRELERSGLLRSDWLGGGAGPARRVYKLTAKGSRQLQDDAHMLRDLFDALQLFFEHYGAAAGSGETAGGPARRRRKPDPRPAHPGRR